MTNFKKLLLAGTAVVAIGAFSVQAHAQANIDVGASGEWGDAGGATGADLDNAAAGDNANFSADGTITVTNDTTNDDGSVDTNTFALGDITDSAGVTGNVDITTGTTANLGVTIGSLAIDGNVTVTGDAADDADITVDLTNTSTIGGNLVLDNSAADAANTIGFTAGGDLTVTGMTTVSGGTVGGSDSTLTLNGNGTFTGGVTLTDGTGLAVMAVNVTTDGTDLTVEGDIVGGGAGQGTLNVDDADATTEDLVTFTGNVGATGTELLAVNVGTGATGGAARFDGDVLATDVVVGATTNTGNASADLNGDVTGNLDVVASTGTASQTSSANVGGDVTGTVTLTDAADAFGTSTVTFDGTAAQTVTGAVDTSASGAGSVVVGDGSSSTNVTFDSAVGATGLGSFQVAQNGTANISNDLTVDSTTLSGLDLDGTLNVDTTGAVVIDDTGAGTLDLDGTLNVTGTSGLTIGSTGGGNIQAGFNDTDAELITNDVVTLDAGTGDLLVGDSTGDNYTVSLGLDTAGVDGGGNALTVAMGATLTLGIADGAGIDDGDTLTWLTNFDAASDLDGNVGTSIIVTENLLLSVDTSGSSDTEINGVVSFNDATATAGISSASGTVANALLGLTDAAAVAAGPEIEAARDALIAAPTTADANLVAQVYGADVTGGAQLGVVNTVTNSSTGITGERLASLRSGDETGIAAGNMTHGLQAWGKVFGTTGEQDDRDGVAGYDVDTYGVTVGLDTQTLAEDWVWGVAFTYADSEVDRTISAGNSSDVELDTFQFTLYGDYKWDAATYINGQLGYAMNDGDQSRTVGGTAFANADVDSDVFFIRLETGRDYDMDNGWTLTPIAMMNYQHINNDDYTETGACGAACLTVDTDNLNIFELGLGGEASYLMQNSDGSFLKPKLHAGYRYDFIGDEVEATSSFAGVAGTFTTEGFDAQQSTFNVGAGLEFFTTSNWELSVNYDYELKEDYDGHNGYVRAAYKF